MKTGRDESRLPLPFTVKFWPACLSLISPCSSVKELRGEFTMMNKNAVIMLKKDDSSNAFIIQAVNPVSFSFVIVGLSLIDVYHQCPAIDLVL